MFTAEFRSSGHLAERNCNRRGAENPHTEQSEEAGYF